MNDPLLILDFGNTRDKSAVYQEDRQIWRKTWKKRMDLSDLRQICNDHLPVAAIMSSVTEERPELRKYLDGKMPFVQLSHLTPVPFKNRYGSPETLGRDRIALVAAARLHVRSGPVLVIDAGTCITYDILDKDGSYHGGGIAPGIWMRIQAMHTFTARLPLVTVQGKEAEVQLVGDSTERSLQSGALHGAAAELDGMIDRYRELFPELRVLLTGGDAIVLESLLKNRIFAVRDLVLEGLNKILTYNVPELPNT